MRNSWTVFIFILIPQLTTAQNFGWANAMGGPAPTFTPNDRGYALISDQSGNLYTTGAFVGTVDFDPGPGSYNLTGLITHPEMFIQKLDSNGNFIWAKQLRGNFATAGYSITLDDSLNLYISGYFWGSKDFDPGPNNYVLTSSGMADIFVLKLDTAGNFKWARRMGGTGPDGSFCIDHDRAGNIYIGADFQGLVDFDPGSSVSNLNSMGNFDIAITKLDKDGNFIWAKRLGGTGIDRVKDLCISEFNRINFIGSFSATADFDPGPGVFNLTAAGNDIVIAALDTAGNYAWAKQMTGQLSASGNSLESDSAGYIYYTGSFWGEVDFDPGPGTYPILSAANSYDIIISNLDENGDFRWAKRIGSNSNDEGHGLVLDSLGNVYTTGFFSGLTDFDPGSDAFILSTDGSDDFFVQKMDYTGKFIWAVKAGGSSNEIGVAVNLDRQQNIFITGAFHNTVDFDPGPMVYNLTSAGDDDIFIQKLTQSICPRPSQPAAISGSNLVIAGQSYNYSISPVSMATGYTWTVSGGTITSGQNSNSITASWSAAGSFQVNVAATNACGSSPGQLLAVNVTFPTAINTPSAAVEIAFEPNPTTGNSWIITKGAMGGLIHIEVLNASGQLIKKKSQQLLTTETRYPLDLRELASGQYWIKLFIGKKIFVKQVLKY